MILPEQQRGNLELATQLRTAYFGGEFLASAIVDATQRLPLAEADRLFDQALLLYEKFRAALAMPLSTEVNAVRFTQVFLTHQRASRRLDFEIERFRHRCQLAAARPAAAPPAVPVGETRRPRRRRRRRRPPAPPANRDQPGVKAA